MVWAVIAAGVLTASQSMAGERGAKSVLSLREVRNAGVVRQYWDLSCGAAALATLLTYQLGDPVSERQVALAMLQGTNPLRVRQRFGFSLFDLKRYAVSRGFSAVGYTGLSLDEVVALAPAIVPIRQNGFNHFGVLRDSRDDRLVIADPAFGNRSLPREKLQDIWADGIGFTVSAPGASQAANRMKAPPNFATVPSTMTIRAAETDARNRTSRP
jgi:predicted double-glycine peptidase